MFTVFTIISSGYTVIITLSRQSATDVKNLMLHCLLPFGSALLSQSPGRTFYQDFCNQKLDLPFFCCLRSTANFARSVSNGRMTDARRLILEEWKSSYPHPSLKWIADTVSVIQMERLSLRRTDSIRKSIWGHALPESSCSVWLHCIYLGALTIFFINYILCLTLLFHTSDCVYLLFDYYSFTVFRIVKQRLYSQTTGLHLKESTRGSGVSFFVFCQIFV